MALPCQSASSEKQEANVPGQGPHFGTDASQPFRPGTLQHFGRDSVYAQSKRPIETSQDKSAHVVGEETGIAGVHTDTEASVERFGRDSVFVGPTPERDTLDAIPSSVSAPPVKRPAVAVREAPSSHLVTPTSDLQPLKAARPFSEALHNQHWIAQLDQVRSGVKAVNRSTQMAVASATVGVATLSVGFVLWLLRGGLLLSSVIASMPAWLVIDPLIVLARPSTASRKGERDRIEELFKSKGAVGEISTPRRSVHHFLFRR